MERINATTGSYNFIDLFAGAGGLSEGFIQAGFSPVAHVEMNPYAAQTLETRTGYYYLKAQMLCLVALIEFAVAMAMLLLERTMLGILVQKSCPKLRLDRLNHSFRRS